jgi:hypothetical protein
MKVQSRSRSEACRCKDLGCRTLGKLLLQHRTLTEWKSHCVKNIWKVLHLEVTMSCSMNGSSFHTHFQRQSIRGVGQQRNQLLLITIRIILLPKKPMKSIWEFKVQGTTAASATFCVSECHPAQYSAVTKVSMIASSCLSKCSHLSSRSILIRSRASHTSDIASGVERE